MYTVVRSEHLEIYCIAYGNIELGIDLFERYFICCYSFSLIANGHAMLLIVCFSLLIWIKRTFADVIACSVTFSRVMVPFRYES